MNQEFSINPDDPDYKSYSSSEAGNNLLRIMVNDKLIQPMAVDSQEFKNKAVQILTSNSTEYIPHGLRVHAYIFLTGDSHYKKLIKNYFKDTLAGPLGGPCKHPTKKDFIVRHPYEKEVRYNYFKILKAMQNKW